ncbi:cytochrome b/b6 domain-containing protein [Tranquillimonas alkanivorans]|uniref:Cytochrome b561 n=1 Tax=Tranquillimonas alkanivorans TaxID=441119 RepID=A0A1I5QQJ5_9RHOB|nr:cytochrome b/b6 domain-containing protein [Tranquillimonas alkanivorans]SFP48513.1 Cytochrome b561 [Tranquillimonas alkanivorans]
MSMTDTAAAALGNTRASYGGVAKTFHWLTALLILTLIPLGLVAHEWPYDTADQLAVKARLFSLHKTLGVLAFFVALGRILWALIQPRPHPLHPERRGETLLAEIVHWSLYAAIVVVPLSGWIMHAASEGFAPILWPLGQSLPLVPKSTMVEAYAGATHWVFTKVLIAALILHVAGALKHAMVDRDATLARMLPGRTPAQARAPELGHAPAAIAAAAIYALGFGAAYALVGPEPQARATPELAAAQTGNWTVQEGTLGIQVRQFGNTVEGSFADWTADIAFAEEPTDGRHGDVTVQVAIPSLTLGSVTSQALGADYFAAEEHPTATFQAEILPAETGYVAEGTLALRGATVPVTLPFTLDLDGDTATMSGATTLDRRNFDIGAGQTDPDTLAFGVDVTVDLTAQRATD